MSYNTFTDGRLHSARTYEDPTASIAYHFCCDGKPAHVPAWITIDPTLRRTSPEAEYSIIRTSTHDGTHLFTEQLIGKALTPLMFLQTCHKRDADKFLHYSPTYRIGWLRIATVFGMVKLPASRTRRFPGERQSVTIPVVVTWHRLPHMRLLPRLTAEEMAWFEEREERRKEIAEADPLQALIDRLKLGCELFWIRYVESRRAIFDQYLSNYEKRQ